MNGNESPKEIAKQALGWLLVNMIVWPFALWLYSIDRKPATDGSPPKANIHEVGTTKAIAESGVSNAELKQLSSDLLALKNSGLLYSFDPKMNEALVNPELWRALPYDTKAGIAATLARAAKAAGDTGWVQILDYRSRRRLAKHSSWGFKVYED